MTYEFKLGKQGYDVYNKTTGEKMNKNPLSSKSKARALIRTLTDKKNENKNCKTKNKYKQNFGRK